MVGPVAEPAAEDFRSDSTQPTPGLKLEAGTAGRTGTASGDSFHTGGWTRVVRRVARVFASSFLLGSLGG